MSGMASQAVKIVDGGKLIIPAQFRRKLGIDVGDTVVVEMDEDGLHVRSLTSAVRQAQNIVRGFVPDDAHLADDLSAERRAEAERE
jgi:AbrB family looped-hinge helix DNA binding protein